MPVDLTVQGAEELAVIVRRLRQTGDNELRKELLRGLRAAAKPLTEDVKRSALANLPRRGGLNRLIGTAKYTTQTKASGRNPGVRIVAKLPGHDLKSLDAGSVRHPVFGNKNVWVEQSVPSGFFTTPLEQGDDVVRKELLDVLEDVARRIVRG